MRRVFLLAVLLPCSAAVAAGRGGDIDACTKGQTEVAKQAEGFHGEDRIRRLIQADLQRAQKEEAEGDAGECNEALEHATKLIKGEY